MLHDLDILMQSACNHTLQDKVQEKQMCPYMLAGADTDHHDHVSFCHRNVQGQQQQHWLRGCVAAEDPPSASLHSSVVCYEQVLLP